jgi:hypothetical protein
LLGSHAVGNTIKIPLDFQRVKRYYHVIVDKEIAMTFRELLVKLQALTEDQLDMDAVVLRDDVLEYVPVSKFTVVLETDVLDETHPVIVA